MALRRLAAAVRSWRLRRRLWRRGLRELASLFAREGALAGTSLRRAHRGRVDLVDIEADGEELRAIHFTILRHPRPYAFSRQHHRVMERYRFDLGSQDLTLERSLNLSRVQGRDGEPGGGNL